MQRDLFAVLQPLWTLDLRPDDKIIFHLRFPRAVLKILNPLISESSRSAFTARWHQDACLNFIHLLDCVYHRAEQSAGTRINCEANRFSVGSRRTNQNRKISQTPNHTGIGDQCGPVILMFEINNEIIEPRRHAEFNQLQPEMIRAEHADDRLPGCHFLAQNACGFHKLISCRLIWLRIVFREREVGSQGTS